MVSKLPFGQTAKANQNSSPSIWRRKPLARFRTTNAIHDQLIGQLRTKSFLRTRRVLSRAYSLYNPLRTFVGIGLLVTAIGLAPVVRFLYFFIIGAGSGHIQSLVLGGVLTIVGFITLLFGILADLVGRNRQLLEMSIVKLRNLEARLDKAEQ